MQLTRSSIETAAGPTEWFTGAVYIDAVATPSDASPEHEQRSLHAGFTHSVAHRPKRPS
jgi:hypothetical protein